MLQKLTAYHFSIMNDYPISPQLLLQQKQTPQETLKPK